ncbi:MAG TPA: alkaline phosphatase family protein [Chloroflexota bacterium]|nr:alkaline phosphatase family protein [Chloroflexota bacterium]
MVSSLVRLRLAFALLLGCILAIGIWRQPLVRGAVSTASGTPASPPYLVVIVIDGFRPDYATLAPMRHLRDLMAQGMSYDSASVGQLEAETPASHATIVTGVYPRKHGVIGFGWRTPDTGQFTYMPTNVQMIQAGDLFRVIEGAGVPTISDLIHSHNRHEVTVSASGEKLWASAPMGTGADYVLYGHVLPGQTRFVPAAIGHNPPPTSSGYTSVYEMDANFGAQDDFAARVALKLVASLRPKALFLNLPDTDIAGHYYGGMSDPRDMTAIVKGADAAIGLVMDEYKRLGIYDKTDFVVLSDHGMVAGRHSVPIHSIYKVVEAGATQLDQALQSSVGAIWLKDPQRAGAVASSIEKDGFPGVEGALYKVPSGNGYKFVATPATAAALPRALLRAYLDLADTEASVNGADILLPYKEDTTGLQAGKKFHGMHGGFSWGSQHIMLTLAGPGIRHGVSHFPARLVDIAPTIERLLSLPIPSGVDGVVLADALSRATAGDRAVQEAVRAPRQADLQAIEAHSAAQSK